MADRPNAPARTADGLGLGDALERAAVGVCAVDDAWRVLWANDRALGLLARSAEDILGQDVHELLHCDAPGLPLGRHPRERSRALLRHTSRTHPDRSPHSGGAPLSLRCFALPCEPNDHGVTALIAFQAAEPPEESFAPPTAPPRALSEKERLALLADTTAQLIDNVDAHESLRRVVGLMLPRLAEWAVIDLITEANEVTRSLVVRARDGALEVHEELQGPMPPVPETSTMPLSKALRGAASTLTGPETYEAPPDSRIAVEQRRLFRAAGIETAAIAPIRGPREVLGALTLGRISRHEAFTTGDLGLLEDIGRRIGIALENARHYQRQRQVAETMQRYLLPQLPELPGVEMTTRYVSAPDASHVGGDWYDAFTLPGGDAALVIGDVVGHDLEAAAGMAQLRNMLRAFAWSQDQRPHRIVECLDEAMGHISDVRMATLILARLTADPGGHWRLRWASAGHPPPLLVDHEGATRYLDEGNGLLLGSDHSLPRLDARIDLPPGSTLVFYTDGLIETRRQSLDVGLERLRRHAASLARRPLDPFADQLLERTRPADNDDDVALLAIRLPHDTARTPRTAAPGPGR
ncbi:SpoIIE family protein phosphatase [Streptomyces marincola]|uniref:protein-serine/threonine phosphatase n=1 Tax=Streptomyces marincola TaxID=2878388 RepID=A0A1W7CRW4_9ACTN|nr:SpoIIE family protein phosphatase [Streptomyces marincola]ARQ67446.1 DNA-binding protein [Streptomyces marincola]